MATHAKVKQITFKTSVKMGFLWKPIASYSASKASLPQAVTAFQKWFDSWKFPQTVYRIDAEDETGKTVWQSSHNPTTQPTGAA